MLAAGCGSDDDDDSSSDSTEATSSAAAPSESLTKTEFLTQGNAICAEGDKTIDQAFSSLGNNPTDEQATQVITTTVVPAVQTEIDGLKALGAPSGDEAQVTAVLDAAQTANDALKADPTVILNQGSSGSDPFAEANRLAKEYGLTECAD